MPRKRVADPAIQAPVKTWKELDAERNAEVAATLDLIGLCDSERAFLATCQKIYRQETGCNTPFEEFFNSLVVLVEGGRLPTPDMVAHKLETFRENWDSMKRDSSRFLEAYPEKETANA